MRDSKALAVTVLLLCCVAAAAKDKKKPLLPADILQAKTVMVVIDPHAGVDAAAPLASQTARRDVERALVNWGRFELVTDISTADLIISIRKGNGGGTPSFVGGIPTGDDSASDASNRAGPANGRVFPEPPAEIGSADDTFVVYRGKRENALAAPAVWRYAARNALQSPGVPAVDQFEKLILEAEKQQATKP
jgi:hypothetical protein